VDLTIEMVVHQPTPINAMDQIYQKPFQLVKQRHEKDYLPFPPTLMEGIVVFGRC